MDANAIKSNFQNLDFGTVPSAVKMEEIVVTFEAGALLGDYAKAFINEAARRMPLTAEQPGALTQDELLRYCNYLLTQRVNSVRMECPDWRKLKVLWIPSFIQFILSQIGEVTNREFGIRFTPVVANPSDMTFEEAAEISNKVSAYQEKLQMVKDAMPRGIDGDADVMSCAVIGDYVRSTRRVTHIYATYVSAFLNAKLQEEFAFKALYRIQYDDIAYIAAALTAGGDTIV